jgi:hypothetical protein
MDFLVRPKDNCLFPAQRSLQRDRVIICIVPSANIIIISSQSSVMTMRMLFSQMGTRGIYPLVTYLGSFVLMVIVGPLAIAASSFSRFRSL